MLSTAVTIGRAIPGMYLLHDDLRPSPIGIIGQIYISGPQVVERYFISDKDEVSRFQLDPWSPGSTMYCTGDKGYWTDDLEIQFAGRRDRQINFEVSILI